jgi:hypothetical protein
MKLKKVYHQKLEPLQILLILIIIWNQVLIFIAHQQIISSKHNKKIIKSITKSLLIYKDSRDQNQAKLRLTKAKKIILY